MEDSNKLYMLLGEMSADIKNILIKGTEQDDRLDSHSRRITAIEKFQWKVMGAATAVSIAVGYLVKLL